MASFIRSRRRSSSLRRTLNRIDETEDTIECIPKIWVHHEPVEAIVLQPIRPSTYATEIPSSEPVVREWGKFRNHFQKLHHDEQIAREHAHPEIKAIIPLRALTDASPPSEWVLRSVKSSPCKSSPCKSRRSSASTSAPTITIEHVDFDARAIYLTPPDKIPTYPPAGSVAYYEALALHPQYVFDRVGLLKRSHVTDRIIALFQNPQTAPEWACVIPITKPHYIGKHKRRSSDPDLEPDLDEWIMYWETLIVKEDIRRGCPLAVTAANELAKEKAAEIARTIEEMERAAQKRISDKNQLKSPGKRNGSG